MLEYEKKDQIGIIKINNPPMNVLCTSLLSGLNKLIRQIKAEDDIRALILTGVGRAFVAGADIKEMMEMGPDEALAFAAAGHNVMNNLSELPGPVIAAVNGFALGGGTELALACDIRIASKAAKFGQPEVNLGVIPGFGGTQRLPRLVGPGKAKELIFTGNIIDAEEALSIGLAQRVVEGYERDENGELVKNEKGRPVQDNGPVLEEAVKMAKNIASKGPLAIEHAKDVIDEGLDETLSAALKDEQYKFAGLFTSKDQKEGMSAFVEKRKPDFKGE